VPFIDEFHPEEYEVDNLILGMAVWKYNLLTSAVAAAVAFEMLSLWSYVLREMMVPL
jgi:hypothetical protein